MQGPEAPAPDTPLVIILAVCTRLWDSRAFDAGRVNPRAAARGSGQVESDLHLRDVRAGWVESGCAAAAATTVTCYDTDILSDTYCSA